MVALLKGEIELSLIRWDPFDELVGIRDAMNRVFDETFAKRGIGKPDIGRGWHPSVDMYETEDDVVVRADLPGVDQKDIEVTVTDNALTIKGESEYEKEIEDKNVYRRERSYGRFARTLLSRQGKSDQAHAEFKTACWRSSSPVRKPRKRVFVLTFIRLMEVNQISIRRARIREEV